MVAARDKFFSTFDRILKEAAAQTFTADLLKHAEDSMKAGKSAADAAAAFSVDKYPGYKKERVQLAIQAVYDELKK